LEVLVSLSKRFGTVIPTSAPGPGTREGARVLASAILQGPRSGL